MTVEGRARQQSALRTGRSAADRVRLPSRVHSATNRAAAACAATSHSNSPVSVYYFLLFSLVFLFFSYFINLIFLLLLSFCSSKSKFNGVTTSHQHFPPNFDKLDPSQPFTDIPSFAGKRIPLGFKKKWSFYREFSIKYLFDFFQVR